MTVNLIRPNGWPGILFDATIFALGEIDKHPSRKWIVDKVSRLEQEVLEKLEREKYPLCKTAWIAELEAIRIYKTYRKIQ